MTAAPGSRGLTIGQAARFAGVTVKTVRHYHRIGLLAEPARDASGYRRYRSDELLRLVRVRTVAAAGVPLAEVDVVLGSDDKQAHQRLADAEAQLTERIEDLVRRRAALRRLSTGDRLMLGERACAVLERLTELGFEPGYVAAERESLILMVSVTPELLEVYLAQLEKQLSAGERVDLMKDGWEARLWSPTDPRLGPLARRLAAEYLRHHRGRRLPEAFLARSDAAARYAVVNHHGETPGSALGRLTELVEHELRAAGVEIPRQ